MRKYNLSVFLFSFSLLLGGCRQAKEVHFVQQVTFPEGATPEEKIDMAARVVPSEPQLAWQQCELAAFLHFGMNTFTGNEWGSGADDPAVFNPTDFDAEQWVKALQEGGYKMAILTAKHHDGFCLWPTSTTDYSVASSKWMDGKGDVVKALSEACRKYGVKFGVYLSPWDRHAPCYGDSPQYNEYFIRQLTELLTDYGEIHEVWFDGACGEGPNGKKQEYDFPAFRDVIARLQPEAVTAIVGNDVRWVGNENGLGRETEWSVTPLTSGVHPHHIEWNAELGIDNMSKDLGSRALLVKAKEVYWYPSEVDVSIRPGWFYHQEQDNQVKSLEKLVDIYFQSVGYNAVLLLNVPPDRRGRLHDVDVRRIKELNLYLQKMYATDFITDKKRSFDGKDGDSKIYGLSAEHEGNVVLIQEDITQGQRVENFKIEKREGNRWTLLCEGTTIGYKRLFRVPAFKTDRIRVTVTSARKEFHIANVEVLFAPILSDNETAVSLSDINDLKVLGDEAELSKIVDGKRETVYRTPSLSPIVLDCGKEFDLAGFTYAPVQGENVRGTIYKYRVSLSRDGTSWTKCDVRGEFSNVARNPIPQFVRWGKQPARYLKLEPLEEINGESFVSIAEIGVLTE